MAKLSAPTEQDTFDHILGSGCIAHSWWVSARSTVGGWAFYDTPAPDGWVLEVEVDDPEGPAKTRKVLVDHKLIMGAIRAISGRKLDVPSWGQPSAECVRECRNFLFNRDAVDFDGDTADQVLQVATLGATYYG